MTLPPTTVGIPLHRSSRWVDVVSDTIRTLPADITEIIVSDRTLLDDAAETLREQWAHDPRVRVVTAADGLHWTAHLQSILEQASGEYFCWMPHDDSADQSWVPTLVHALERHPDAWLAHGTLRPVLADGITPHATWAAVEPPSGPIGQRSLDDLMLAGRLGVPFRGVVRRAEVIRSGIRLEEVHGSQMADLAWVYRIGLRAPIVGDPGTATRKRVHADSTFIYWTRTPGDLARLALAILENEGPRGMSGALRRARMRRAVTAASRS